MANGSCHPCQACCRVDLRDDLSDSGRSSPSATPAPPGSSKESLSSRRRLATTGRSF